MLCTTLKKRWIFDLVSRILWFFLPQKFSFCILHIFFIWVVLFSKLLPKNTTSSSSTIRTTSTTIILITNMRSTDLHPCIYYRLWLSQIRISASVTEAVLPSRKSDKEISKSDFYQTIFQSKIKPKADPNSQFLRSKSDFFQKPNSDNRPINFYLKKINICRNYQVILGFVWKAENMKIIFFGLFRPKSRLFKQKEDQFGSIFFKKGHCQTKVW